MYVYLTTRCNMSCAHCCMNAAEDGEDMSMETWAKVKEFVSDYDESISLGGGEPTLHPHFWQILGESLALFDCELIWMATNGSQTEISLALAKMAEKGLLGCALSQDGYHDPIDERVVKAFTKDKTRCLNRPPGSYDFREIRDVTGHEVYSGRCDWGDEDNCVCPGVQILVDGTIRQCGCADAPTYGTVWNPQIPDDIEWCECYKFDNECL